MKYKACRFCEGAGWLCDECYVEPQIGNLMAEVCRSASISIKELNETLGRIPAMVNETATGRFISGQEMGKALRKILEGHAEPVVPSRQVKRLLNLKIKGKPFGKHTIRNLLKRKS